MDGLVKFAIIRAAVTATLAAQATGLASCNSVPYIGLQSVEALMQKLTAQGW
jgi:predicted small secreted protein